MIRQMREIDPRNLDVITRQRLFADLPEQTLRSLLRHCETLILDVGDVLLTFGQTNTRLYFLLAGQLKVHIDYADSDEGFVILPGECVGEISIIDGKPTTAQVFAEEPSRVLAVPDNVFWEEFLALPDVAKNFLRLFAARFRARNEAIRLGLEQQLRYEHLQKELTIARDIQCGMLPHHLDLASELEIAAEMTPAQHVGGDFFDAFPVGPEEYCLAIGDIAGKGVPAALFVVRTMTLLRAEMLKGKPINDALNNLNRMLCEENPTDMFATLIVGLVNVRTGSFVYANAGHDAIAYSKCGTAFRWLTRPYGILAGIDERATYGIAALDLAKGDTLVLYTDGITEAMNANRELFTSDRLLACLNQAPGSSAQDLVNRIKFDVQQFVGNAPQSDDLTMLVVCYRGSAH